MTSLFRNVGILGAGLIGGSLAKALHIAFPEMQIRIGARRAETRDAVLADGCAASAFDSSAISLAEGFDGCDLVILATTPENVCESLPKFKSANIGLIVDVGSVKGSIMAAGAGLGNFIGGHPMAGTEGKGFGAADANLFRNAAFLYCVPADYTAGQEKLDALIDLVRALTMRPYRMDAAEHDRRLAVISHLPHVAAFALAELAARENDASLAELVGGGFRDTTRIAASSPDLWTDILRASPELPATIDRYLAILTAMRDSLTASVDPAVLHGHIELSEQYRKAIPAGLTKVPHA